MIFVVCLRWKIDDLIIVNCMKKSPSTSEKVDCYDEYKGRINWNHNDWVRSGAVDEYYLMSFPLTVGFGSIAMIVACFQLEWFSEEWHDWESRLCGGEIQAEFSSLPGSNIFPGNHGQVEQGQAGQDSKLPNPKIAPIDRTNGASMHWDTYASKSLQWEV